MSPEPMSTDGVEAACVLWCASDPPAELISSLRGKGVSPVICTSAFGAMAEICSCGTIGRSPRGGAILLIAEPAHVRGKKALLTSCKKYAPWLRLWVYQHDAPIQLRPLDVAQLGIEAEDQPTDAIPMHRPPAADPAPVVRNSAPSLRLSGEGAAKPDSALESDDDSGDDGFGQDRLLSDDELSMLLSDELDLDD
ncbi:MAG: hypothetical protein ACIARQ_10555 [Phycisphaerales bacterium JB061]